MFSVGSGVISWSSKRQQTVALSSCESELMAQTQATKEAIWPRKLLSELRVMPDAAFIYGDNRGAIALSKNAVHRDRTASLWKRKGGLWRSLAGTLHTGGWYLLSPQPNRQCVCCNRGGDRVVQNRSKQTKDGGRFSKSAPVLGPSPQVLLAPLLISSLI